MTPRNPPCSATGTTTRSGCTAAPAESAARARRTAGMSSSIERSSRTRSSESIMRASGRRRPVPLRRRGRDRCILPGLESQDSAGPPPARGTLVAALLAILAAAVYGVADFCGGIATRRSGPIPAAILSQGSGLVALLALAPLLPGALHGPAALGWSAGAGLAGSLGLALLYYGLARGPVSVVAPITGVCSIAVPVLVGLGLGERPGLAPLAGIALAVLAVALIGQAGPANGAGRRGLERTIAVALASGVAIGLFLVALARTGRDAGLWPLVVARGVALVALGALALAARR